MEAVNIICGAVGIPVICLAIASPYLLEMHAREKFTYSFFSKRNCVVGVIASMPLWLGHFWLAYGNEHHDAYAQHHALAFMAFGIAVSGYLLYRNIKLTSLWYGLGGSLIQIPVLLYFCVFALPAMYVLGLMKSTGSRPMTNRNIYDDWYWNPTGSTYIGYRPHGISSDENNN
jgi:hypothetical protein